MHTRLLTGARLCLAAAALAGSFGAAEARGSVSVDINVGLPVYGATPAGYVYGYGRRPYYGYYGGWYGGWYRPWGPSYIVVDPPVAYAVPAAPAEAPPPPPTAAPPSKPDPVIYPRNKQSAEQLEADRQECNRWAVTQPAAVADASVFQRAVEACMDARGYTVK